MWNNNFQPFTVDCGGKELDILFANWSVNGIGKIVPIIFQIHTRHVSPKGKVCEGIRPNEVRNVGSKSIYCYF